MKAMIFAAGMGTRLKPITDTMPKALVPVCGKPLLSHVIEKLHSAGFSDFVINLHHFADQIRDYVQSDEFMTSLAATGKQNCEGGSDSFGKDANGIKIHFSDETDLLRETGGGIRHAAALLNDGEPFLVHNVDILSNLDVESFYRAHYEDYMNTGRYSVVGDGGPKENESHGNSDRILATLLVSDRKTERYLLFDSEDMLVGWMNIKTGEVKSPFEELRREPIAELKKDGVENVVREGLADVTGENWGRDGFDYEAFLQEYHLNKYAFAGIHVMSPEVFALMWDKPDKFSIITFYLSYCHKYRIKGHVAENLKLVDVGKLDSLQKAEEMVAQL